MEEETVISGRRSMMAWVEDRGVVDLAVKDVAVRDVAVRDVAVEDLVAGDLVAGDLAIKDSAVGKSAIGSVNGSCAEHLVDHVAIKGVHPRWNAPIQPQRRPFVQRRPIMGAMP
ncbi:hypothetical protein LGR54_18760 [Ancylobacter sp. Lp-2]|uniref:hypothetical protein n=1 Tax=Ancylobacter sp. Lp-2 TaxID=2881339 RepID=UPI001E2A94B1|nr:hypothetical protein [Ancylobacter sp. Lp-2]MCB4770654.1 hypothetical protein [Ancylobacter sp. Lp-2]